MLWGGLRDRAVATLEEHLRAYAKTHGGLVLAGGHPVEVDPQTRITPDLHYYRPEHAPASAEARQPSDHPHIAVVVVAPDESEAERDRMVTAYAQAGVAELWRVDPQRQHIEQRVFVGGYQRVELADRRFEPEGLPEFAVDVPPLFRAP